MTEEPPSTPPDPPEIPFADELVGRLIRRLSSLREGERLPSERALADTLGVSRTALRDRLMRLEAIGVVERRAGSGTYLRGLSSRMTSDTLAMGMLVNNLNPGSMMPVRRALEREAARQAAMRVDHINLAHMAVALDRMASSVDDGAFREADHAFHTALIAASGVPGLEFFGEMLRDILWATVREVPLAERVSQLTDLHVDIYQAVRDSDPDAAMRAVDVHFDWFDGAIARGTISGGESS
ncbi:MAG: FadR/GntR family transcriptional regulator [Microbacterium sp.]